MGNRWNTFMALVSPNGNGNQPEPPVDPYTVIHVTNEGIMNEWAIAVTSRDETIADRDKTIANMTRIGTRVIPRISKLAMNIGKILRAKNTSVGEPTSDETGMVYKLSNDKGAWLTLVLYPFAEIFTLSDPSNNMQPREFRLGLTPTAELDETTILILNGFAEFVARQSAEQTSSFLTTSFNRSMAPVGSSVHIGASSTDSDGPADSTLN